VPRITMHVEGRQVVEITKTFGDVRATCTTPQDNRHWKVDGTGTVIVRISQKKECPVNKEIGKEMDDNYMVEISPDKIRVHQKDVPTSGAMTNVFVDWKNPFPEGVHIGAVQKK
jgi:hypothetical protein